MMSPTVYIRNLNYAYADTILFNDFNFTLSAGKCTALLGPSGVGKTTLLRFLAHLSIPHGEIYSDIDTPLIQQIAYMAQTDSLLPWLTAFDNALLNMRLQAVTSEKTIAQAHHLFKQVGLEQIKKKFPSELSGGMRQRVALVRTLLQEKPVILMDEPFSSVDAITRFELQTLVAERLKNRTVLLVTHDPLEALRLADEIYILSGQPAKITQGVLLSSPTPRNPENKEVIIHQMQLFSALMQAKEIST